MSVGGSHLGPVLEGRSVPDQSGHDDDLLLEPLECESCAQSVLNTREEGGYHVIGGGSADKG